MKDAIIGITALPVMVGVGAELTTIVTSPNGIVIPGESLVGVAAGADGATSDEALGVSIDTAGVGVGIAELLAVTKF